MVERAQGLNPYSSNTQPGWRNGRRGGLKSRCPQGRAGSTPAPGMLLAVCTLDARAGDPGDFMFAGPGAGYPPLGLSTTVRERLVERLPESFALLSAP